MKQMPHSVPALLAGTGGDFEFCDINKRNETLRCAFPRTVSRLSSRAAFVPRQRRGLRELGAAADPRPHPCWGMCPRAIRRTIHYRGSARLGRIRTRAVLSGPGPASNESPSSISSRLTATSRNIADAEHLAGPSYPQSESKSAESIRCITRPDNPLAGIEILKQKAGRACRKGFLEWDLAYLLRDQKMYREAINAFSECLASFGEAETGLAAYAYQERSELYATIGEMQKAEEDRRLSALVLARRST